MQSKIILYTQPNCMYCDMMKGMLAVNELEFEVVDISNDITSKIFLHEQGHKTVPQLYVNDIHINKKDTLEYTASELNSIICDVLDHQQWKGIDGGIEHGF
jgi:glutaredoxin